MSKIKHYVDKVYSIKGRAVIYNQDCIAFLKSQPDNSIDVIVTDPAYSGMNQKMKFGNGRIVGRYQDRNNSKWFQEFHDNPEHYRVFLSECLRVLKNNRHIYIMFDSFSLLTLGHLLREFFEVKNIITWDKVSMGMGHYFRRRHEFIIFATKGYRKLNKKSIPDVWCFKRIHAKHYPTQKPVELFESMLVGSIEKNFMVCDPFIGSGSAGIAALKKGCNFIGCDSSHKACELSWHRLNNFIDKGVDELQKIPSYLPTEKRKFWE
jgi:site-specific DNA-methyltransferase (adenine-specific)